MPDLIEIAASGATFRLFNEADLSALPDRIPLLPKPGTYRHPEYGDLVITAERNRNFAANINNAIFQKHIPINAEHAKGDPLGALGWFSSAVVNEDGSVDAPVDWADRGKAMLAGKAFRYVSPEWHERWIDKASGVEHQDVVVGLALTTRPFFKDSSLRPLVASEHGIVVPPSDQPGANGSKPEAPKGNGMEFTEQQYNELKDRVSDLTQKFTDSESARLAAETKAQAFADRVSALEAAADERALRDRVKVFAFNDADANEHLAILKAIPAEHRDAYIAKATATATMVKNSKLFTEIGSDASAPNASAEAKIAAKARQLAETKGITYEQAFADVMDSDRELRGAYVRERGTNVDYTAQGE